MILAGGVNDVIYPAQELMIAKLTQPGIKQEDKGIPVQPAPLVTLRSTKTRYVFSAFTFTCSISCEGSPTEVMVRTFREAEFLSDF